MATAAGLAGTAAVNNALLTRIMAIAREYQTPLDAYLGTNEAWAPDEGMFAPIMEPDILAAFDIHGETIVTARDEFGEVEVSRPRAELGGATIGLDPIMPAIASRGGIFPSSRRFLFTVDWDSFFTLVCGPGDFLRALADARDLDGFFCDSGTQHFWSFTAQ